MPKQIAKHGQHVKKGKGVATAKTPDSLRECFEKHVPYEIGWLVQTYRLLLNPEPYRAKVEADIAKTLDDALIVGFCTHARNLLEFFSGKPNPKWNYAISQDYAKTGYVKLDRGRGQAGKLYPRLCAEINHLTYERTDKASEKIGPKERKELIDLIRDAAGRLGRCLKSEYALKQLSTDQLDAAARLEIRTGAVGPSSYPVIARTAPTPGFKIEGDSLRLKT